MRSSTLKSFFRRKIKSNVPPSRWVGPRTTCVYPLHSMLSINSVDSSSVFSTCMLKSPLIILLPVFERSVSQYSFICKKNNSLISKFILPVLYIVLILNNSPLPFTVTSKDSNVEYFLMLHFLMSIYGLYSMQIPPPRPLRG